ncbi:MAG TPA: hypothetical protein VLG40_00920 [Candidatus Saccharimonas sp.]|nr:hypothetical protein [Candidatus Saccharimonas sp.]
MPGRHHHCSHSHSHVKEMLDDAAAKAQTQRRRRSGLVVALVLRACSLLLCPGDDIAAILLQLYDSVSGTAPEHHGDVDAIMPKGVEVERLSPRSRKLSWTEV